MNPGNLAFDVWATFKAMHPNNGEPFVYTEANLSRWLYHINETSKQPNREEIKLNNAAWQAFCEKRKIETWEDFPQYMKTQYLEIADYFPGSQVYAVGSRVNGEFVEAWSDQTIRDLRKAAGKSDKKESDYDFVISPFIEPRQEIPSWADWVAYLPLGEKKIPIPSMWNFSKLPEAEHQNAIEALKNGRVGTLVKLHNDYHLSDWHYCGCGDEKWVVSWFRWALDNGHLKPSKSGELESIK